MQKDAEKKENPPSSLQKKGCGGILNATINRNLGGVGYFGFRVAFHSTEPIWPISVVPVIVLLSTIFPL